VEQISSVLWAISRHSRIYKVALVYNAYPGTHIHCQVPDEVILTMIQVNSSILSTDVDVEKEKEASIHQQLHVNRSNRMKDAYLLTVKLAPDLLAFPWKGFTKTGSEESLCYELLQKHGGKFFQDHTVPVYFKRQRL